MGFFTQLLNTNISCIDGLTNEARAEYISDLNSQRAVLTAEIEKIDELLEEQARITQEEADEIARLKTDAITKEAELLEQQAAELRAKVADDVVSADEETKVSKSLPEPKAGENITLTSENVTIVGTNQQKPSGKKTAMAAALTEAMLPGLTK